MTEEKDPCPLCGHGEDEHSQDGCLNGWRWRPDGVVGVEGCDCYVTGWV